MADLLNQRVLIVGGSGAMGSAVAGRVASSGGKTTLVGRDKARLEKVVASLAGSAQGIPGDFVLEAEAARIVELAGRVDHIVLAMSSAGGAASSIPQTDLTGFKAAHARLWASYNAVRLARHAVEVTGSIVLISGSSARRPGAGFGVWTTVHGGIEALGRAAAIEIAPIRVNVVSPGGIGMQPDRQLAAHPGTPHDVAAAVVALLCNRAITNAVLDVDGGERLGLWSGGNEMQTVRTAQ